MTDHELIEGLKALEAKATDEIGRVTEQTAAASCEYHDLLRTSANRLLALAAKGLEAEEHLRLLRREVGARRERAAVPERGSTPETELGTAEYIYQFLDPADAKVRAASSAVDAAGAMGGGE